jgi:hypothetical protein
MNYRNINHYLMKQKILLFLLLLPVMAIAQDDLLGELEKNEKAETDYTIASFKGTRLVNGHTIEAKDAGSLEFIFSHRFGTVNSGWYEMYGLDQAYVRIGLDYGFTDQLSASIGRNSIDKTVDGYLKYKVFRQSTGDNTFPISMTALGGAAYKLSPKKNSDVSEDFKSIDRLSYTGQLLIARKFTSELSLQLMPTFIHKNSANQAIEENDQIALGIGGRYKVTPSVAITGEYYHNLSEKDNSPYHNALGFGLDIETGGHVFQLVFTNAIGLTERAFITETEDDFFDGDIHFGFNVTRNFQLKKNKKE